MKCRFTLIEMLVVVAIIAILASILLPSLSRVRQSAKRSVCLSQMKQLGPAVFLYLKNNDSKFPRADINSSDHGNGGRSWFGKKGTNSAWPLGITERPMNKYIGLKTDGTEAPVCKCPFNDQGKDAYNKVGSSYSGNGYSGWSNLSAKDISVVIKPSTTALAFEHGTIAFHSGWGTSAWERRLHYAGRSKYPFLKVDSSVAHHEITKGEGITFKSANINLNIDL